MLDVRFGSIAPSNDRSLDDQYGVLMLGKYRQMTVGL